MFASFALSLLTITVQGITIDDIGSIVQIRGVKSHEYNNRLGMLHGFDESSGRWGVKILGIGARYCTLKFLHGSKLTVIQNDTMFEQHRDEHWQINQLVLVKNNNTLAKIISPYVHKGYSVQVMDANETQMFMHKNALQFLPMITIFADNHSSPHAIQFRQNVCDGVQLDYLNSFIHVEVVERTMSAILPQLPPRLAVLDGYHARINGFEDAELQSHFSVLLSLWEKQRTGLISAITPDSMRQIIQILQQNQENSQLCQQLHAYHPLAYHVGSQLSQMRELGRGKDLQELQLRMHSNPLHQQFISFWLPNLEENVRKLEEAYRRLHCREFGVEFMINQTRICKQDLTRAVLRRDDASKTNIAMIIQETIPLQRNHIVFIGRSHVDEFNYVSELRRVLEDMGITPFPVQQVTVKYPA